MNDAEGTESVAAEAPESAPRKKPAKKGKAKVTKTKKGKKKATGKGGGGGPRKLYSLKGGLDLSQYDKKTHEGAVIHALKKLGEASSKEIREQAVKDGFKTGMKTGVKAAISFAIWDLSVRQNIVKSRAKPKEDKKKAA
jgi:hypothetical protein